MDQLVGRTHIKRRSAVVVAATIAALAFAESAVTDASLVSVTPPAEVVRSDGRLEAVLQPLMSIGLGAGVEVVDPAGRAAPWLSPFAYLDHVVVAVDAPSTTALCASPASTLTTLATSVPPPSTPDPGEVTTTPAATTVRSDRDRDGTARQVVFGVVVAVLLLGGALIAWTARRSRGPS